MARPKDGSDLIRQRLRNSRLTGAALARPEQVVAWFGAMQAQDYAGAKWALAQRLRGSVDSDLDRAFDAGKILRTHVLRPTWHFVLPDDLGWMLSLSAPRIRAFMAPYDRKLELDEGTFRRSNAALAKALQAEKHQTRSELARALAGVRIQASGQRLGHLMMRAELDQVICSGPRRGKQFTYALLDERAPKRRTLAREDALGELARRYVASHGPCLVHDFAWWSGLSVSDARAGIELVRGELEQAIVAGKTYWFASRSPALRRSRTSLHLLPNYDEYLIAYKDHSLVLDGTAVRGLGPHDHVLANHIIVQNGKVIGGWRRDVTKETVVVESKLLEPLSEPVHRELEAAAWRYANFLELSLKWAPPKRAARR